jgi:hypothetical protein
VRVQSRKEWLLSLEFELEYKLRQIIREHGLLLVTDPKVKHFIQNLIGVRKALQEVDYERDHHQLRAGRLG